MKINFRFTPPSVCIACILALSFVFTFISCSDGSSGSDDDEQVTTNPNGGNTSNPGTSGGSSTSESTYIIKFDLNGGEGTLPANISAKSGDEITLPSGSFAKSGYEFKGWCTTADGTGSTYEAGSKTAGISAANGATVTLYAKWVEKGSYSINYELGGGTNAESNPASFKETSSVFLSEPTRQYYAFCGWFTDSAFTDSSKITGWSAGEKTGDITLYAKWEMTLESLGLADGKIVLTGDIPEETLRAVAATILANPDENITLDLGGTTITEIPDKLFKKLSEYGDEEPCENLVGIILPKKLKSIGEKAFGFCIGLTEIEIPSGTTSISDGAFLNTGIKSAKIPASIETVGLYAFSCARYVYDATQRKIETVEFGGTLAQWQNLYVGKDEDRDYYGLQHATVTCADGGISCTSDNFEEVLKTFSAGREAHIAIRVGYDEERLVCTVLRDVMKNYSDIKVHLDLSKVKTLDDNERFKDCTNLVGIEFSTLDKDIWYNDFEGCTGLKSITIPANIITIQDKAFYNCTGLEEVTFLGNISNVDTPFEGCTKLSKVNFPEGLTRIPKDICHGLTGLKSIKIPASVTEIGEDAFNNSGLTSVELPSGLKVIERMAFYECKGFTSVEIPAGVTRIGEQAFAYTNLASATINAVDIVLANPFFCCTALTDVYYAGTMDDWEALKKKVSTAESESNAVEMAFSNAPLTTATIHYEYRK